MSRNRWFFTLPIPVFPVYLCGTSPISMSPFPVVTFFSVLTVAGQLLSLLFLVMLVTRGGMFASAKAWISSHALLLMLIISLSATIGSLFFSEIAGWTPCKLCWFQRIFMYPQVFLLAYAIWKKDRGIAPYILMLSIIGLLIAAWHYGEQVQLALNPLDPDLTKPCDQTGVSCARTPFFNFGYITIPMMALTAFALNALGSVFVLRSNRLPA